MDERLDHIEEAPCFYAAMVMYVPASTSLDDLLNLIGVECICERFDDVIEVLICEVDDMVCWEVSGVLKALFKNCNIENVEIAARKHKGTVFIDMSFVHKETYPSLIFDGEEMQIIHKLQAEIGIDPY